ncbi:MAG: hypothetical protein JXQ27_04345 [Acidobacteria bacterium]|nr:hypothetical protein [Acidobacteriota bacterium]
MSREVTLAIADVVPEPAAVLRRQGMPLVAESAPPGDLEGRIRTGELSLPPGVPPHIRRLLLESGHLYLEMARPRALLAEITTAEFARVYAGNGQNEPHTPLADIFPRARRLWLFTLTVGDKLSQEIERRLAGGDYALGVMLDSWASEGAEQGVSRLEEHCRLRAAAEENDPSLVVLSYSPGYCGWNIRAQRELFAWLQPAAIGLKLNESCLMWPLKSVSGVLVAAPPDVHRFEDRFPFCRECRDRTCRRRMAQLADAFVGPGMNRDRNDHP